MKRIALIFTYCLLSACGGVPEGARPVSGFELQRYLGKWYEIARLDHSFERGLVKVSAEYSLREDGGIRVINRGYDPQSETWDEAEGKAYFVEGPDIGRLKVSFFGPFYGAYNILTLDKQEYQYALVAGPNTSYLWILAREPQLDRQILQTLVGQARALGFAVDDLIYVSQE